MKAGKETKLTLDRILAILFYFVENFKKEAKSGYDH
jgi:hypothetical protein